MRGSAAGSRTPRRKGLPPSARSVIVITLTVMVMRDDDLSNGLLAAFEALAKTGDASVRFARAHERTRGVLVSLTSVEAGLEGLLELDEELRPEIETAQTHLLALCEALERASKFLGARFSAAIEANRLPRADD